MIKYVSTFRLVLRCLLVARKENSTGFSTGLTGRSKNLDPTGNPTDRSARPVPVDPTGFHLCTEPKRVFQPTKNLYGFQNDPKLGPSVENACQEKLSDAGARNQQGYFSVARMPNIAIWLLNLLWL